MQALTARKTDEKLLKPVLEAYGGLEELAMLVLDVCPGFLEGDYGLKQAAEALDLPPEAFGRAVSTAEFQQKLDEVAAYSEYSFTDRRISMRNLRNIATTSSKHIMGRRGDRVEVDRDAEEIIKADSYLRKLQGRPMEDNKRADGGGITIVFGSGQPQGAPDDRTVTIRAAEPADKPVGERDGSPDGPVFAPSRPGDLPPQGARRFYRDEPDGGDKQARVDPDFDFSREETAKPRGTGSVTEAEALGKKRLERGGPETGE